jgi:hypothetical protein
VGGLTFGPAPRYRTTLCPAGGLDLWQQARVAGWLQTPRVELSSG